MLMNGVTVDTVASSWIEALGGLSQMYMRSVPPCFWANAEAGASSTAAMEAAATIPGPWCMVSSSLRGPPQVYLDYAASLPNAPQSFTNTTPKHDVPISRSSLASSAAFSGLPGACRGSSVAISSLAPRQQHR